MLITSPRPLVASSPRRTGTRRAKAPAVAEVPTISGMIAFARSACASSDSASAAHISVAAATSLPCETATLPRYSAEKPIAAESEDMAGTSSSTTLADNAYGDTNATITVDESKSVSTGVSCGIFPAASSSMDMSRCMRPSAASTRLLSASSSLDLSTSRRANLSSTFTATLPMPMPVASGTPPFSLVAMANMVFEARGRAPATRLVPSWLLLLLQPAAGGECTSSRDVAVSNVRECIHPRVLPAGSGTGSGMLFEQVCNTATGRI